MGVTVRIPTIIDLATHFSRALDPLLLPRFSRDLLNFRFRYEIQPEKHLLANIDEIPLLVIVENLKNFAENISFNFSVPR